MDKITLRQFSSSLQKTTSMYKVLNDIHEKNLNTSLLTFLIF